MLYTSEKEKMLAGTPYDAWESELLADRMRAKSLCARFNMADPTDLDGRMAILRDLLSIKDTAHMEPNFFCE